MLRSHRLAEARKPRLLQQISICVSRRERCSEYPGLFCESTKTRISTPPHGIAHHATGYDLLVDTGYESSYPC
eukprot:326975-Hanusia_phi.AAC.1